MELFPETIDMVIRMLRAGVPVTGATARWRRGSAAGERRLHSLADQMAIGITFEEALALAGERIGLPDFRFFVVAISLQRATGGNLASTLDILSDIMRKRPPCVSRPSNDRRGPDVGLCARSHPVLVIGGLLLMTPDYLQPLISDSRGNVIIAAAVGSLVIGFVTIGRMMRSVTTV